MSELYYDGLGNRYEKNKNDMSKKRVASYAIIKDLSTNKFLFFKPHETVNMVKLIGGGVKNNESIEDGLIREIEEETELVISNHSFYFLFENNVNIKYFFEELYVKQQQFCFYLEIDLSTKNIPSNIVLLSKKEDIIKNIHFSQKDFILKYFLC